MKHLLVTYVYTTAVGSQKFHHKEVFVELSGSLSDIDINKELVREIERKTPNGSAIINVVDLTNISKGPCVDAIGRELVKRFLQAYVVDIDAEGEPMTSMDELVRLMDDAREYLNI